MSDKPRVRVEYILVKDVGSVIGTVLWEHDFHMMLDALAYVPAWRDEVKPPGLNRLFRVARVRREYLKTKTKFKVILVKTDA